jgi:hypothetical protein
MEAINCMLGKMSYLGASVSVESDKQFLKYLGEKESRLSNMKIERKSYVLDVRQVKPGNFMFYKDTENPNSEFRLVQCISQCNPANECFALTVKIVNCKIDISEYSIANEEWDGIGHALQQKTLTINRDNPPPSITSILVSNEDPTRKVVFKKMDEAKTAKCTEYIPEVKTIRVNEGSCKMLTIGNIGALGRAAISPPSRFIDDGLFDNTATDSESLTVNAYDACYCTFLAMYQREVSTGDSQLSIKRYFCNNPLAQTKLKWKVYCGRVDDDPTNPTHTFIEKPRVRWIDDKYVSSRLTAHAKTWEDIKTPYTEGLIRYRGEHTHIFINIFIILQHWTRHDAEKGPVADELLWRQDQTYSPYDIFYRPSFHNAQATNLRTYDFTITQVLRNWILGVFTYAHHETLGEANREIKLHSMQTVASLLIMQGFDELNTLLHDKTDFPTPIVAGTDTDKSPKYDGYKLRAITIMKKAVTAAFPLFTLETTRDDEIFVTATLTDHIITQYLTDEIKTLPPLMALAATSLVGTYHPSDSEAYSAINNLKKWPIISPYKQKKDDIVLIYDTEGVSIAYFDSVVWCDRLSMLSFELRHFEDNNMRLMPDIERQYRENQFQFYAPAMKYTTTRGSHSEPTVYVRDIFNVYVVIP